MFFAQIIVQLNLINTFTNRNANIYLFDVNNLDFDKITCLNYVQTFVGINICTNQ